MMQNSTVKYSLVTSRPVQRNDVQNSTMECISLKMYSASQFITVKYSVVEGRREQYSRVNTTPCGTLQCNIALCSKIKRHIARPV